MRMSNGDFARGASLSWRPVWSSPPRERAFCWHNLSVLIEFYFVRRVLRARRACRWDGAITSGATGMQSATMRSAPRGAMAAAHHEALVPTVSRSAMQACQVDRGSACLRALAVAALPPCCSLWLLQVESRSLDPSLGQRSCECSNDHLMHR